MSLFPSVGNHQSFNAGRVFLCMAASYFWGAFNDNFYKQAALLVAVTLGMAGIQGRATMLFALPFLLFSALGGWLADRYSKKSVIVAVKVLELLAVLLGAVGLVELRWNLILAMVFLLSLQSSLFGPALNAALPELYPPQAITLVNARLKLITTLAILIGIALAGVVLDSGGGPLAVSGRQLVAVCALFASIMGLLASLGIHRFPAQKSHAPFPWRGPVQSMADLWHLRSDRLLALAIAGAGFFYFLASLVVLQINVLGIQQLGYSSSRTSLLGVCLVAGICAGAFLAARLTSIRCWTPVLAPALLGLTLGLVVAGLSPAVAGLWQLPVLSSALAISGACGGLFLIPQSSFIQVRPPAPQRGKVIAAANFCAFGGILLSGQLFTFLDQRLSPAQGLLLSAGLALVAAASVFAVVKTVAD
ncbi:MAG: MFS transporter [Desulfuromonadaceae bacterium]|nr:MFS transporter [Desulfuromonadaceae bacterium]